MWIPVKSMSDDTFPDLWKRMQLNPVRLVQANSAQVSPFHAVLFVLPNKASSRGLKSGSRSTEQIDAWTYSYDLSMYV